MVRALVGAVVVLAAVALPAGAGGSQSESPQSAAPRFGPVTITLSGTWTMMSSAPGDERCAGFDGSCLVITYRGRCFVSGSTPPPLASTTCRVDPGMWRSARRLPDVGDAEPLLGGHGELGPGGRDVSFNFRRGKLEQFAGYLRIRFLWSVAEGACLRIGWTGKGTGSETLERDGPGAKTGKLRGTWKGTLHAAGKKGSCAG